MKVQFYVDSGANIHSCRKSGWLDIVADLRYEEGEWEQLSEDEKYKVAEQWASEYLEIGFEDRED